MILTILASWVLRSLHSYKECEDSLGFRAACEWGSEIRKAEALNPKPQTLQPYALNLPKSEEPYVTNKQGQYSNLYTEEHGPVVRRKPCRWQRRQQV